MTRSLQFAKTGPADFGLEPTAEGSTALTVQRGRFFRYRHDPKDPGSLSSDAVLCLLVDRQGVLWVGTQDGGLNRFDRKTGRFKVYRNDPNDPQSLAHDTCKPYSRIEPECCG